jgi:hypothetical protein
VAARGGAQQFAGLSLAEITADRISLARDHLAAQTFRRGRPRLLSDEDRDRLLKASAELRPAPHHTLDAGRSGCLTT